MIRRNFNGNLIAGSALGPLASSARPVQEPSSAAPFLERPVTGQPHKGKVLLALQAHSDDVPLEAAGTVAKLIEEDIPAILSVPPTTMWVMPPASARRERSARTSWENKRDGEVREDVNVVNVREHTSDSVNVARDVFDGDEAVSV